VTGNIYDFGVCNDMPDDEFKSVDGEINSFIDDEGMCISAASFVAKLKSHSSIPALAVDEILWDVQEFFTSEIIGLLKTKTVHVLMFHQVDMTHTNVQSLMFNFERLGDLFNGLKTEYQQIMYFQKSGHYIALQSIIVGHRVDSEIRHGSTCMIPINATAQHIPLRKSF
jgi:hypothetical protein